MTNGTMTNKECAFLTGSLLLLLVFVLTGEYINAFLNVVLSGQYFNSVRLILAAAVPPLGLILELQLQLYN